MVKEIPLKRGGIAYVDDLDFENLNQYSWYGQAAKNTVYAVRVIGKFPFQRTTLMHREIMGFPKNMEIDHINGNGLDNRRSNLRICTTAQNQRNSKKRADNTSGYKGVVFYKPYNKWMAHIRMNGKKKTIGYFDTAEQAARAYDKAAREMFGEFAKTNFNEEVF